MLSCSVLLLSVSFHVLLHLPSAESARKRNDDVNPLQPVVEQLVSDVNELKARLMAEEQKTAALEAAANRSVAFSAYVSEGHSYPASEGAALPFNAVTTNVGGGFSPATSAFTAPHPGLYFFLVHVDCSTDYRALVITLNGHKAFAADNDAHDGHVTGSSLLTLKTGDVVTTAHYRSGGSIDPGIESTFTGFLVK